MYELSLGNWGSKSMCNMSGSLNKNTVLRIRDVSSEFFFFYLLSKYYLSRRNAIPVSIVMTNAEYVRIDNKSWLYLNCYLCTYRF